MSLAVHLWAKTRLEKLQGQGSADGNSRDSGGTEGYGTELAFQIKKQRNEKGTALSILIFYSALLFRM